MAPKKAAGQTRQSRSTKSPLPSLDDPRWLPVAEVYKQLLQRAGDVRLADFDLNKELGGNRVQFMRRSLFRGDCELVPSGFGADHCLSLQPDGSIALFVLRDGIFMLVEGWVFYAWEPHVKKVWPAPQAEIGRPREGEQLPRLERQMVIAILRDAYPDGFSADDIPGKVKILDQRWPAECKAPLGDPGRKGMYKQPHPKTIARAIRDYKNRPEAYPPRRRV